MMLIMLSPTFLLLISLAPAVKGIQIPFFELDYSASSYAGASTSAIYPPPHATNTALSLDSYFPDATEVGFPGATATGDEAALITTATAVPLLRDTYPLLSPPPLRDDESKFSSARVEENFDILRHLGHYSPRFSVDSSEFGLPNASASIPQGCDLRQVHLLFRHGARYPTAFDGPPTFAKKVHETVVNGTGFTGKGDLEFLNTWSYKLGEELLTPFGRKQLFDLGVAFRIEYGELLKGFDALPVFSHHFAQNFAAGFFGLPEYEKNYRQLITVEESNFNNTMEASAVCPNGRTQGKEDIRYGYGYGLKFALEWADIYLQDARERLQEQIDGLNLTVTDVLAMQELCAFETVALGSSVFCNLFTREEWEGLDYFYDIEFWFGFGPGNPTAAAQGIGYVHELLSRITQTPIPVHNSSTNATINNNNVTFPLDQPIYVDATHDTSITTFLVALNFTNFIKGGSLPRDHIPGNKTYSNRQTAPFAATLLGQVLFCPSRSTQARAPSSSNSASASKRPGPNKAGSVSLDTNDENLFFRWILNDGVVPQTGVAGCGTDADGLCPLDTYIAALQMRLGEVDFYFDCNGNYTVPDPDLILDGRPPADQRPH